MSELSDRIKNVIANEPVVVMPPLPKLGHWHTRDFTAAIAPASQIVKAKDRKAEIDNFLQAAVDGAIKILN